MADYSQIQRCIKILQLLSTHKYVTTSQLEERFHFSVSRRTLQRDLIVLSDVGIPLITEKIQANENAWSLMDSFKSFIPIPLDTDEFLALQLLKSNLTLFNKTKIQDDVKKLSQKIDQLLPENLFISSTKKESENLFSSFNMGQYDYSGSNEIIKSIMDGIFEKRKCLVIYDKEMSGKTIGFYVEPEKLLSYHGGLYVIVYIRNLNKFRILAVHRIVDWKVYDEIFPDDHSFNEKEFMKNRFGLFEGKTEKIKLKFKKSIRHLIEHKTWHSTQIFLDDKNQNLTMEFESPISPELISWIMSWHKNVRVTKPNILKEEIINNLKLGASQYS
jgi:predicted DNA-binding transcriptional regulator YafY